MIELAILIYGGIAVLDDRDLLMTLIGTRNVDWSLLVLNLGVTAIALLLLRLWTGLPPSETALVVLHLIFGITWVRAPSVSPEQSEG